MQVATLPSETCDLLWLALANVSPRNFKAAMQVIVYSAKMCDHA
jgi:hypothetical protein